MSVNDLIEIKMKQAATENLFLMEENIDYFSNIYNNIEIIK